MSVDYRPTMGEYKPTGSFKFWCQKVLPLVYDDSLSYYETLCKVTAYLNDVIQNSDTLDENVRGLYNAYVHLQDYVNNYFDNLNVQNEINEKLDNMASDGSLSNLIQPLFDTYKNTIDNTVNTQNEEINVLKARMDTFTSLPEGSTTGDAELIDARIGYRGTVYANVGDHIRSVIKTVNTEIENVSKRCSYIENQLNLTDITVGSFVNSSNGVVTVSTSGNYNCTDFILVNSGQKFITTKGVVQFAYYNNGVYVSGEPVTENTPEVIEYIVPDGCNQIRFSLYVPNFNEATGVYLCDLYEYINNTYMNINSVALNEKIAKTNEKLGLSLINAESEVVGEFYNLTNANNFVITNSPSAKRYDGIPITKNKTYYYNDMYAYFCIFISESGELMRLSDSVDNLLSGSFNMNENGVLLPTVSVIDNPSPAIFCTPEISGAIIECGTNKEYTTLRSAIEKATEKYGSKVIVYPGVYDLTVEFADVIEAQSGTGCILKNSVEVEFMSGAYVQANFDVSNTWAYTFFEPFKADGDFTLNGLNIEASNCRYCVHDDISGIGTQHHVYKNCIMKYTNEHPEETYIQCIGGGMGEHSYIEIDGGIYTSITNGSRPQEPISYHNGISSTCDGEIFIKNVYLTGTGRFRFGMYGDSPKKTPVVVNGCSMGSPIYLHYETPEFNAENFELFAWNNVVR